ncbi:MAG: hypothetical protein RLZZ200_921 [Pseudomonadota bacterium]
MALGATIHTFEVELSDVDRGVYQSLNLRVARHPSESPDYLVARVLAYCLEYTEGIAFSKGLSEPDEPAVLVRDLTGQLQAWIEVGLPATERLHRASKAAPRVAVYAHKDPAQWARGIADAKIHRAEQLAVYAFDRAWMEQVVAGLERRVQWSLARSDSEIYLTAGDEVLQTVLQSPLKGLPD